MPLENANCKWPLQVETFSVNFLIAHIIFPQIDTNGAKISGGCDYFSSRALMGHQHANSPAAVVMCYYKNKK
jgi:hypothetical protein